MKVSGYINFNICYVSLITDYCTDSSTSPCGISLRANLSTEPDDAFFSDVFPFPEGVDACPGDAFISLTPEVNLNWMNLRTACPGLRITGYAIPPTALNATLYVAGESPAQAPSSSYVGAHLQVWANLTTDILPVNQFFSILQPENSSAVSVGYWEANKAVASLKECGISILGTHFTTDVEIDSETGLEFTEKEAYLFDQFKAMLVGSVEPGHTWDDFPLHLQGVFSDSDDSFPAQLQNYTYSYAATEVQKAEERVQNSLLAIQKTKAQLNATEAEIDALSGQLASVTEEYTAAFEAVIVAQEGVQQKQDDVDAINSTIQDLVEAFDEICPDMECGNECIPSISACMLCNNLFSFPTWGIMPVIRQEDFFEYGTVVEAAYEWINEPASQNCFQTTIVERWGQTSFGQNCFDVYRPRDVVISHERAFTSSRDVEHMEARITQDFKYDIQQPCCPVVCGEGLYNPTCLYQNAACKVARQPAFAALTLAQQQLLAPTFALSEAKEKLIAAQAELAIAELKKATVDSQNEALLSTKDSLEAQLNQDQANYDAVVQEERAFLDLGVFLLNNSIDQLLQIKEMRFNIEVIDQSPDVVPVDFTIFIPSLSTDFIETIDVDFTIPLLSLQRELAEQLLEFALGKNLLTRKREVFELPLNYQLFEQNCARLVMLQTYLLQINESVNPVLHSANQVQENITTVISDLLSLIPSDAPELDNIDFDILASKFSVTFNETSLAGVALNDTSYLVTVNLINELVVALVPLSDAVGGNPFLAWQSSMEMIHTEGMVDFVAEEDCLGFTDCLTKVGIITQEMLEDTPGAEPENLLMQLQAATWSLVQLGLATDMNLTDSWSLIEPLHSILSAISFQEYWCSTPPVITLQPPELVAAAMGEPFNITCRAESTLVQLYSWKKDGFLVPGYDTNSFHQSAAIPLHEGKYQCLSTNAVGTTGSVLSTLDVHNPPMFTLQPGWLETYENDDDGAWFICNTTGNPVPGYEWYYSTDQSDWELVSNDSNLFYVANPLKSWQGWYRCRAYTEHAELYSEPAYLTILSASFSQLVYPVSFELVLVSSGNGSENITGSGSEKEGVTLENTIKSVLSEFLDNYDVEISNVVVSEGGMEGVLLVSLDVSLTVPFLLNETIADQAKVVAPLEDHFLLIIQDFEEGFTKDTVSFEHEGDVYETNKYSLETENQTFACPSGQVLKHGNFICGELLYVYMYMCICIYLFLHLTAVHLVGISSPHLSVVQLLSSFPSFTTYMYMYTMHVFT